MSKFLMPDGKREIEKNEFLQFYSDAYYLRNNKAVEDTILKIFDININDYNEEHIKKILAWKTGAILQQDFHDDTIKYKKEFEREQNKIKIYGKIINLSEVLELLKEAIDKEEKKKDDIERLKAFMHSFYNNHRVLISGLGPVYALTLRFFASRGNEPIYDSFARQALWSITEHKSKLPRNPSYENIVDIYDDYLEMIRTEFRVEYDNRKNNRDNWRKVDQALWMYGHCFHVREFAKR